MHRRTFLGSLVPGMLGVTASGLTAHPAEAASSRSQRAGTFALDGNEVRFFTPSIKRPFRVCVIADTHLFLDDTRGEPYRPYSARMAQAYNQTRHFRTGEPTHPQAGFESALNTARTEQAELVVLAGDLLSFPSEAGVEWAQDRLRSVGLPYVYVAGNHDWHYEGLPGTSRALRADWIHRRLAPLYQGRDPFMTALDVNGIRLVVLDNSTYEIEPAQLKFFRTQVRSGRPLVLIVHIPLYAPGRSVGFGCGHPDWGAKSDRSFELERRPRWPEAGHTATTRAFHREVFGARNLLGVIAGHIHHQSMDVVNGIPQIVTDANATGAYLRLEFLPSIAPRA